MADIKIFLASSQDLSSDREQFEIFINRKNIEWKDRSLFIELIVWENFLDAISLTRLQDKYNEAIRDCDIFVSLFDKKVGKYTEEEFDTAYGHFKETNKPFVFTYFNEFHPNALKDKSLFDFQEKLRSYGHFYTKYKNIEDLKFHFNGQLEKLYANSFRKMEVNHSSLVQNAEKIYNIGHIDHATFD